jgi:Mrp family chromosome partitioning ATPase
VDYVIVDTPPASMMADAAALCRHADKVVYVIREDFATKHQIRSGIQTISSQAKLCGFVMNMTTTESSSSYGYGYGYGYGYTKTPGKRKI